MLSRVLFISSLLVLGLLYGGHAQTGTNNYEGEYKPLLYKNTASFGLNIHSAGWGIDFRRGKNINAFKKKIYEFEFVGIRHPKQIKSVNPFFENAKSYFYGKTNSLLAFRAGMGRQKQLFGKADRSGVEIRLNYSVGPSFGITKPVYLDILYPIQNQQFEFNVVTEKYDPDRHRIEDIYGRAAFTNGLDELKVTPGLYGKVGLSFEYGSDDDDIKAIETGIVVDAYSKEIPIMAFIEDDQIFFNFYINILYGKKW